MRVTDNPQRIRQRPQEQQAVAPNGRRRPGETRGNVLNDRRQFSGDARSTQRVVRGGDRGRTRGTYRGGNYSYSPPRGATRYDFDDAARYDGFRARNDARNARIDRYRDGGRYRDRDRHRERDNYQPHVSRRHGYWGGYWGGYYRPYRHYSSTNLYFGFGGYYGGPRFGFGYYSGYWPWWGYNAFYAPYDHYAYFSHWPHAYGYYGYRSTWAWAHHHHHYHYGTYCPGFDGHHSGYYGHSGYAYSDGDQVAGTLLGAVVGGIIGAEIDGGYDRTAGTVIGAVVGASIGAAATADNHDHEYAGTYQPYSGRAQYDADGRHVYERDPYTPPEEVRSCVRYEYRGENYVCTKWTVEYVYDEGGQP